MCKSNKETLNEVNGNYIDTIRNLVFKTQKYINVFHFDIKNRYADNDGPMLLDNDISGFVACEAEEILKNKLLRTAVDIKLIIQQKSANLRNKISGMDDDVMFCVSQQLHNHLYDMCNLARVDRNRYVKSDDYDDEDIYDLEKSYNEIYAEYSDIHIDSEYLKTNKDGILKMIDEANSTVYDVVDELTTFIEKSPSVYNSLLTIHKLMKYMIITYFSVSKIKLEYPE